MAVVMDMDNKARIPADREAAEALADKYARETGKEVRVYQKWSDLFDLSPDYLVTIEPEPLADAWSRIYAATPDS
jgi:hypothetical protein